MDDIKDKYKPETHQTVCGMPWRWLDVIGDDLIAIRFSDVCEIAGRLDDSGVFESFIGPETPAGGFNLIPIKHDPVKLPTNLKPEFKYMRQVCLMSGGLMLFAGSREDMTDGTPITCLDIPNDPAGYGHSEHMRINIGRHNEKWVRV